MKIPSQGWMQALLVGGGYQDNMNECCTIEGAGYNSTEWQWLLGM